MVKNLPAMEETHVQSLAREYPLEEKTATHSSILAWEVPWTEEPGRLQYMEPRRAGRDLRTEHAHISSYLFLHLLICVFDIIDFPDKYLANSSTLY